MYTLKPLVALDWAVIAAFFLTTLAIGLYFSRRATSSMADYFVAGRKMTWWLAGTSIVATSFAADTPLVIAGWMRTTGLERNWFWWGGIMGMMLCTFFFARLWRRADILTDVEFNELRYGGKPAASLRIFHASYRSIIQNTLVMGWVTLAMTKILDVTLNIPTLVFVQHEWLPHVVAKGVEVASVVDPTLVAQWPVIGAAVIPAKVTGIVVCLSVAALYSTVSGLWGVVATDFFQFCLAMTGTILLMFICLHVARGPSAMVTQAETAVADGRVLNRTATPRFAAQPEPTYQRAGLQTPDDTDGVTHWAADGLTEADVLARLAQAGAPDPEALLTPWREAYTINRSRFTDFTAVDALVAAHLLVEDEGPDGQTLDYLRIPKAALDESELREQVATAGVTEPGEFLAAWRKDRVVSRLKITSFLPPFDLKGGGLLAVWSIVVFLGLQWWVGGEGGGYLAQRLFSCKNEKHSVLAMLWFNFMNYAIRPWPWIVVGIASLFLIPDITAYGAHYDEEHAYVVMMMKYMPAGLKGLLVASLMAAYMSTISTHVNFGASYVVNDLYKRFLRPHATEKENVRASQVASVALAILAGVYAFFSQNISTGWFVMFELMSGVGFVVLLRWYWWRVNAWSELSAMFSSLTLYGLMNGTQVFHTLFRWVGAPDYLMDEYVVRFTLNLLITTVVWVTVTFLTPPEKEAHLVRFYKRIKPPGAWKAVANQAGHPQHLTVGRVEWTCWFLGVTGLFAMIVAIGKCCFGEFLPAVGYGLYAALATVLILRFVQRMDWSDGSRETG